MGKDRRAEPETLYRQSRRYEIPGWAQESLLPPVYRNLSADSKEYEHHFTVHGTLLPGYTVEGQEPVKAEHTAAEVSEGDISLPEKAEKPSVLGKLAAAKLDAKESGQPVRQGENISQKKGAAYE